MVMTPDRPESEDKEHKLDKLDEAYNKMEECFHPLTEAAAALRAGGYEDKSDVLMFSVNNIQCLQDFVREECRQLRGE